MQKKKKELTVIRDFFFESWEKFVSSDKIIVSQDEIKRKIESKYRVQVLENNKNVTVFQIL